MAEETIHRQLGAIMDVLGLEWKSLFDEANKKEAGRDVDRVMGWLYRILDTLDNKTGHLLRFAALLLTAQTVVAGILIRNQPTPPKISIVALILLVVPLFPAIAGLPVFTVKWKFFGRVRECAAATGNAEQITDEMNRLAKICDRRAAAHQWTLLGCFACVISFLATLVLAIIVALNWGLSPG